MISIKRSYPYGDFWRNEDGDLHREDDPAIFYSGGDKYWFLYGKLHNEKGPAVTYKDGTCFWYLNGTKINCLSQEEFERIVKLKAFL